MGPTIGEKGFKFCDLRFTNYLPRPNQQKSRMTSVDSMDRNGPYEVRRPQLCNPGATGIWTALPPGIRKNGTSLRVGVPLERGKGFSEP
jgi:hypothetical protein